MDEAHEALIPHLEKPQAHRRWLPAGVRQVGVDCGDAGSHRTPSPAGVARHTMWPCSFLPLP